MKIAIIGGGITGLTSAFYLTQKGHEVTIFERENLCGGLASGFLTNNWNWHLERTYHHIFSNDNDILQFSKKIGFDEFFFTSPQTSSLYNSRTFPVDTPQDLLNFPLLSVPEKLRAGIVIAFLKISPFFSYYEKKTASKFLKETMGDQAWIILWEELFRKKFGKYAEKIVASFIWARIKKRSKNLGYPTGGFQNFINHIVKQTISRGADIKNNCSVTRIDKHRGTFTIYYSEVGAISNRFQKKEFDVVISTLPTPILVKIGESLFDRGYIERLKKIIYLSAVNLILETNTPILNKVYWLSICDKNIPIMCIVQHTNFIDKKHYGNNHISYVANYVEENNWRMRAPREEVISEDLQYLRILNAKFSIQNSHLFKVLYAQPIFNKEFVKNKPEIITPVHNLYIANLEMTYPYDRGTNFAVRLGKQVAEMV